MLWYAWVPPPTPVSIWDRKQQQEQQNCYYIFVENKRKLIKEATIKYKWFSWITGKRNKSQNWHKSTKSNIFLASIFVIVTFGVFCCMAFKIVMKEHVIFLIMTLSHCLWKVSRGCVLHCNLFNGLMQSSSIFSVAVFTTCLSVNVLLMLPIM